MMYDPTPRRIKVGDAVSQLGNVLFLAGHTTTTANESISGRAHRMRWKAERWINALFLSKDHCRRAYLSDIERARIALQDHDE